MDSFKNFIRDFVELYKGGWVAQQLRKRFHFKNPTAVEEVRQDVSLWLLQASPETFQDVKSVQAYVHFKNPTAVEEVRQDVSLWLLQASPETFQDVKSVQAYVFRILERRQIDQFRRASRERDRIKYVGGLSELAKLSAPSSNIPEEEVFTAQLNQLMLEAQLRAIAALPPKCRQVWDLHAEQGLERSEVARILKIRLSTVANQLSKATDSILEAQRQAVSALLEGRNDKP